jgi:hypothetical protein
MVLPAHYYNHPAKLHRLCRAPGLKPKTHSKLCHLTLTNWGTCKDPEIKQALWDCYFPGTPPHLWHVMYYLLGIPMSKLVEKSGLTEKAIRKYLTLPKVPQAHVRAIGRFALEYRDALRSPKQKGGPDPRYMILHLAMTDKSRMYQRGELSE